MINLPVYMLILFQLIIVTIGDIKHRKISNLWLIVNSLFATLLFVVFPEYYLFELASFQYTVVWIIAGFFLFLLKIMGGGDSKYLAFFFLLVPLGLQDDFFYLLLVSTIVVGVMFLLRNIIYHWTILTKAIKEKDIIGVKSCFGSKFAYAPVILIAWIFIGIKLQNLVSL